MAAVSYTQNAMSHTSSASKRVGSISRKRFYHLPTIKRAAKTDKHSSKIVNMPAKIAQLAFLSLAAAILRSRRFLEASAPASVSKSKSHHLKLLA